MRLWVGVLGVMAALGGPAAAEPVLCTARIAGADRPLAYDPAEDGLRRYYSVREVLHTKWARGSCPSFVVLRALTPELSDAERGPFCLQRDPADDSITGYDVGRRDAYGRCKAPRRSVCQRVNATRDAALGIAGAAARRSFDGVNMVRNAPAGAVILEGAKGPVTQALGSIGGAAGTLAASPAVAAGAAVTVVAVGGAVYACSGAGR